MGFNKKNNDILTEAFREALEEEIADIPNVGDQYEFSPEFEENMEKLVKKSHTINFKLASYKSQRYIAAAIAAAFIISTFTVAAKITPPKTDKTQSSSAQLSSEDNVSSVKEDTSDETSTTMESDVSHKTENTTSKQSSSQETSSLENIQPWDGEDEDEISSKIYAEGFAATYESVFEAEGDTNYIFHSSDRLYHRWNDLTLCGLVDMASDFRVEIDDNKYSYLAVPLSDYPYSEAISQLKGNPLSLITEGLGDCTVYKINYREDMQYLLVETQTQSYLARYLKSENKLEFSQVLEQVFGVVEHTSFSRTAILDMDGRTLSKLSLTPDETETLFSILSKATVSQRTDNTLPKATTKIIVTSEQGGTIHLFYHGDFKLTLIDQERGNYIQLSKEEDEKLKKILGLEKQAIENTSSVDSTLSNSSEVEGATSSLLSESNTVTSEVLMESQSSKSHESGLVSTTLASEPA